MAGFTLRRLELVMEPGNAQEIEGVLNPAAFCGPDGALYLFPRLAARGNYWRIGIARVRFSDDGDPIGVERLGMAPGPEADYELRPGGGGEAPRVTFVEPLGCYRVTYTAFSPQGPRIAVAASEDLFHWRRLLLPCCDVQSCREDADGLAPSSPVPQHAPRGRSFTSVV